MVDSYRVLINNICAGKLLQVVPQIELRGQPAFERSDTISFDNPYSEVVPPVHEPKNLFALSCNRHLQILENAH